MFTYNHSLMNSKYYGNPVFQHGIYQNNLMTNCSTYEQWSYGPFMIIQDMACFRGVHTKDTRLAHCVG
jgi:hypothetical protein